MIFIGITLSMQFNNWNEERKLKQLEIELISDLYVDVVQDSMELKNIINNHDKIFIKPLEHLDSCLQLENPVDFKDLKCNLKIKLGGHYMSMNSGAYECYKHQGISVMKNSGLKIKLFEYYESGLNWLKTNQEIQDEFSRDYMIPLCVKYTNKSLELSDENYLKIRKDEQAKLLISFWIEVYKKNKRLHESLLPDLKELKREMEKELIANSKDPKQILKEAKQQNLN
ncbi:DUF6090 family protein [Ancylomarina sp. DW003]|nr:DUF6090 family protein [Ancylomarina sp. DW003]MDE5422872.1 DUF6090 family protein [Ancylomarina sp. DW003]